MLGLRSRLLPSLYRWNHICKYSSSIPVGKGHEGLKNLERPPLAALGDLNLSFTNLRLSSSPLAEHMKYQQAENPSYKLPTVSYNHLQKKTILDPLVNQKQYELPTLHRSDLEKVAPSSLQIYPVKDPHPLQSIIDQNGNDAVKKQCMPYLVRIRKRKMKKHKLRKLRKRMIFLNRKLTAIKDRKKEKAMKQYEAMWAKRATDFSADHWVEDRLSMARKGGWNIDIWKEYREKKGQMEQSNQ